MPLHLIAMLIYAPKSTPSVHIQHDLFSLRLPLFPRIVIPLISIHSAFNTVPSSSIATIYFLLPYRCLYDPLCNESVGRCCNRDLRYGALVHFNPAWMRDPLGGEALDVFDGMKGGVAEELTDQQRPS
jgi:hypothetical protein